MRAAHPRHGQDFGMHPPRRSDARARPAWLVRLRRAPIAVLAAIAALAATAAHAGEKFVYLTNWFAEAEHGGFYQALATGLYAKQGLDVTIRMGGPQVNVYQLLAAGQADCVMGLSEIQVAQARASGLPVVTVAAMFQKDPLVLIAHDDVKSFADMKSKTLLIAPIAYRSFWPWLKAKYGFTDAQTRPYTFNIQPFVADRDIVQQGYVTSEPYAIRQAGVKIDTFLLADYGYPGYSTTVSCLEKTLRERQQAVAAFVRASAEGWKSYLADPAPGNVLIRKENPNLGDDQLAYSLEKMKQAQLVTGGDAARLGIGIITDARMKASWDFMVSAGLIDPAKVELAQTYTTAFVKDLKVLP